MNLVFFYLGGGKSLCYQLPALIGSFLVWEVFHCCHQFNHTLKTKKLPIAGVTVVIISSIQDQIFQANEVLGIPAGALAKYSEDATDDAYGKVLNGEIRLVRIFFVTKILGNFWEKTLFFLFCAIIFHQISPSDRKHFLQFLHYSDQFMTFFNPWHFFTISCSKSKFNNQWQQKMSLLHYVLVRTLIPS